MPACARPGLGAIASAFSGVFGPGVCGNAVCAHMGWPSSQILMRYQVHATIPAVAAHA